MDSEIIQAYLWREVIRLGFCPSGNENLKKWLHMYGKSLRAFWDINEYPLPPRSNGAITAELTCASPLNMLLSYNISSISKFAVRFLYIPQNKEFMWVHDVDGSCFSFPEQFFLTEYNKRNEGIKDMTNSNVETVLNSLIFHPRAHQHIEGPIRGNHDIRIGGGIDNALLYLFHLRYQLCPIEKIRIAEKKRLVGLFESSIKDKKCNTIAANDLLAQPLKILLV